jgi:hypothetical protein
MIPIVRSSSWCTIELLIEALVYRMGCALCGFGSGEEMGGGVEGERVEVGDCSHES